MNHTQKAQDAGVSSQGFTVFKIIIGLVLAAMFLWWIFSNILKTYIGH